MANVKRPAALYGWLWWVIKIARDASMRPRINGRDFSRRSTKIAWITLFAGIITSVAGAKIASSRNTRRNLLFDFYERDAKID